MSGRADLLLPEPQTVRRGPGALPAGPLCFAENRPPAALVRPAVDYLIDRCGAVPPGTRHPGTPAIEVHFVMEETLPKESYELSVTVAGVEIRSSSRPGFLYGAGTLRQWLSLESPAGSRAPIPTAEIQDRPDFAHRGFLLDISRNKVPTMSSLLRLVDLMADLKLNELQLYMEHTFAYAGHEDVWKNASALTGDEIRQLDGYCRRRCIELVPNQNSFGHFHRWLTHPRYRHLAECPEGVRHAFSDAIEPFSLCPTDPASLELLRDLYGKLLPNFTSGRFHVGFDETFEIGRGRSKEVCEAVGLDQVYLDHLESVRRLAAEHNRSIQIWADMVIEHPRLLPRIPRDVTLCEWGYEAGHPFREDCALLRATGSEVYVCPGTSTWSSFAGRAHNALANLEEAASAGLSTGAKGYLITEWGDRGHLQPFSTSYLGLTAGAALAWNRNGARRRHSEDWARAIDRWVLDAPGSGVGAAALELADAYRLTGASQKNGTAFFHLLMSPSDGLEHQRYRGLSHEGIKAARRAIHAAHEELANLQSLVHEARRTRDEMRWIADSLLLAGEVGKARLDSPLSDPPDWPDEVRSPLRSELTDLAERRAALWLDRNRPGGLEDSLRQFTRLERLL